MKKSLLVLVLVVALSVLVVSVASAGGWSINNNGVHYRFVNDDMLLVRPLGTYEGQPWAIQIQYNAGVYDLEDALTDNQNQGADYYCRYDPWDPNWTWEDAGYDDDVPDWTEGIIGCLFAYH